MFARSTVLIGILSAACISRISADEPKTAESPKLEIKLKDVKKQTTLVIKKTVKRAEIGGALGEIFPKIFAHLGANNIKPSSAPMAKYKVVGDKFEMEGGVIVPDGTKGEGEIVVGELPAGKAAFAIHIGPYETAAQDLSSVRRMVEGQRRQARQHRLGDLCLGPGSGEAGRDQDRGLFYGRFGQERQIGGRSGLPHPRAESV
jgi:effector-binding domain-containing protein